MLQHPLPQPRPPLLLCHRRRALLPPLLGLALLGALQLVLPLLPMPSPLRLLRGGSVTTRSMTRRRWR